MIEAAFCTGEFADVERLFAEAEAIAARDGDREGAALAASGLGMTHHYRNIANLVTGDAVADVDVAAEEDLMRRALGRWQETDHAAGAARGLFGMGLVFQVLHRDWSAAMPYFWQAFGLAEAMEESGDRYGRSEVHRHVGFYYLVEDVRPREAVRQLEHSLTLREQLGDPRRIPSALVSLGDAELAAGNTARAVDLLRRAVPMSHGAALLPWRIADAERSLSQAEAAARG